MCQFFLPPSNKRHAYLVLQVMRDTRLSSHRACRFQLLQMSDECADTCRDMWSVHDELACPVFLVAALSLGVPLSQML